MTRLKKIKNNIDLDYIYQALVESLQDMVFVVDVDLVIQFVNKTAAKGLGMKKSEIIGKRVKSVFPPKAAKGHIARLKAVLKSGKGSNHEEPSNLRGKDVWLSTTLTPLKDTKGKVYGIMGFSRDISKSFEAGLEVRRFKLGIEKSPAAIYLTDINGTIKYANPGFEKIYGYTQDEIIGQNPRAWKTDRYDKRFYKNFWKQILAGKSVETEFTNLTKSGDKVVLQSVVNPIVIDKKIEGFLAIQSNITPLRKEQERVETYKDQLEALVVSRTLSLELEKAKAETMMQNLAEGILSMDLEGKIQTLNLEAERLLGKASPDVIGKNAMEEFRFIDQKGNLITFDGPFIQGVIKSREPTRISVNYMRPDQNMIQMGGTMAPYILNGEVIGVVHTFSDFTKEAELERSKSDFISLTSHQLRTPLTSIKWILEMALSRDGSLDKWQEEFLADALSSTRRMIDLVNDLLNISRLESDVTEVQWRRIDVSKLIAQVISELVGLANSRGQKISFKNPGPTWAYIDRKLIGQVVSNLISNALQYSEKGSSVRVTLNKNKKGISIKVIDKGSGISKEDQKQLFKKFFRTSTASKRSTEGSGLGLYLILKILDLCNGEIEVDSRLGKGSTFTVTLPLKGSVHKDAKK